MVLVTSRWNWPTIINVGVRASSAMAFSVLMDAKMPLFWMHIMGFCPPMYRPALTPTPSSSVHTRTSRGRSAASHRAMMVR